MDTYIIPYNYIVKYNIIEEFNEKHLNLLYGNRSKNAARILAENGYEVVELGTGFRGWVAAGKKIKVEGNKVR